MWEFEYGLCKAKHISIEIYIGTLFLELCYTILVLKVVIYYGTIAQENLSKQWFVTRSRGYETFSGSTQLSTKFILLINVKMPTIVGILTIIIILTIISMINTTSERLKAKNLFVGI